MLLVFDINETLLDLEPLDEVFVGLTGSPAARREWFDLLIHTALTLTAAGQYRSFAEIAGASASAVAARYGKRATEADRAAIGAALRSLPPHPEVAAALGRLREQGFRLAALGNSPLAAVERQLANASIAGLFDQAFSAEQVTALKPAPAPYRQVLEFYRVEPRDAVMVAAHGWDIAGADAVGMRTAFLSRPGQALLPGGPGPTWSASNLAAFADQMSAEAAPQTR